MNEGYAQIREIYDRLIAGEKFAVSGGTYVRSKSTKKKYYAKHYTVAKDVIRIQKEKRKNPYGAG